MVKNTLTFTWPQIADILESYDTQLVVEDAKGYSPRVRTDAASAIFERAGGDFLVALIDVKPRRIGICTIYVFSPLGVE